MAKNIYQLAKLSRRIPRRSREIVRELTKLDAVKGRTSYIEALSRNLVLRFRALENNARVLRQDLALRNVGGFAFRCAFPLKQQRVLGLIPQV